MKLTQEEIALLEQHLPKIGERDIDAFERLYHMLQPHVATVAYRCTHSLELTDDVTQQVMMALWHHAPHLRGDHIVKLVTSHTKATADQLLKARRRTIPTDLEARSEMLACTVSKFESELNPDNAISEQLNRMDLDTREVFILKYLKYSATEISKLKGISVSDINRLYNDVKNLLLADIPSARQD